MNSREAFHKKSQKFNRYARHFIAPGLNYIILVPTLRCNLACSYCQVSRANESAPGFDWCEETLNAVCDYVSKNAKPGIKIEFQGGEPTLRLDILYKVINRLSSCLDRPKFVICSNLQLINQEFLDLLVRDDVHISCSLDGPSIIHRENRIKNPNKTSEFFDNLKYVRSNFGPEKISFVTTVTKFDQIRQIINFFYEEKIPEIFLRPVNYHGFARKSFPGEASSHEGWLEAYFDGLNYIFEKNNQQDFKLIEANFSIHLSKFFNPRITTM